MRTVLLLAAAALALPWADSAQAIDVSGEVALASDYRYRGISLSDGHPVIQAEAIVAHDSGFYLELFGSGIREQDEGYAAELDVGAGVQVELADSIALDLSGTYYLYPAQSSSNYFEAEAILSAERGPYSASVGLALVPPQAATKDEGTAKISRYAYVEFGYSVPGTPVALSARLGHERGYFDEGSGGGKVDWSLGADVTAGRAAIGLAYVGSNADVAGRHALLATLKLSFESSAD